MLGARGKSVLPDGMPRLESRYGAILGQVLRCSEPEIVVNDLETDGAVLLMLQAEIEHTSQPRTWRSIREVTEKGRLSSMKAHFVRQR